MTFTIMAHDPDADQVGIGIATASLAVGGLCLFTTLAGDIVTSQAFARPELGLLVARHLSEELDMGALEAALTEADPHIGHRQIGIIHRDGSLHAFSGPNCRPWSGHHLAEGHLVMGNFLAGEHILDAMAEAFRMSDGEPLAERLLQALEAGRDAGGQADGEGRRYTERSAALKVIGAGQIAGIADPAVAPIDLRVDMHERAVDEMRRLYQTLRLLPDYNALRSSQPEDTPALADWEAEHYSGDALPNPLV
tara:strand:- start:750 stop:1502 length:753 start_codon:yes stop_codon:yes gene_type:complete